jgi:DNA-binding XRE family transcriptional regulator
VNREKIKYLNFSSEADYKQVKVRSLPIRRARNPRARRFQNIAAKAGYPSLSAVARALGVSRETVSNLFDKNSKGKSLRLKKRISDLLGVDYRELWDEEEECLAVCRARKPLIRQFQKIAAEAGYPSLSAVARALGVSCEAIRMLFDEKTKGKFKKLRERVATLLGMDYEKLWSE